MPKSLPLHSSVTIITWTLIQLIIIHLVTGVQVMVMLLNDRMPLRRLVDSDSNNFSSFLPDTHLIRANCQGRTSFSHPPSTYTSYYMYIHLILILSNSHQFMFIITTPFPLIFTSNVLSNLIYNSIILIIIIIIIILIFTSTILSIYAIGKR